MSGLVGVLAFISAAYCFWLMTVPLSYNLVYVVVIGFIVSLGYVCHRADRFIYLRHTFASVTSCTALSADHADCHNQVWSRPRAAYYPASYELNPSIRSLTHSRSWPLIFTSASATSRIGR